jgi:hypothetical protein
VVSALLRLDQAADCADLLAKCPKGSVGVKARLIPIRARSGGQDERKISLLSWRAQQPDRTAGIEGLARFNPQYLAGSGSHKILRFRILTQKRCNPLQFHS